MFPPLPAFSYRYGGLFAFPSFYALFRLSHTLLHNAARVISWTRAAFRFLLQKNSLSPCRFRAKGCKASFRGAT